MQSLPSLAYRPTERALRELRESAVQSAEVGLVGLAHVAQRRLGGGKRRLGGVARLVVVRGAARFFFLGARFFHRPGDQQFDVRAPPRQALRGEVQQSHRARERLARGRDQRRVQVARAPRRAQFRKLTARHAVLGVRRRRVRTREGRDGGRRGVPPRPRRVQQRVELRDPLQEKPRGHAGCEPRELGGGGGGSPLSVAVAAEQSQHARDEVPGSGAGASGERKQRVARERRLESLRVERVYGGRVGCDSCRARRRERRGRSPETERERRFVSERGRRARQARQRRLAVRREPKRSLRGGARGVGRRSVFAARRNSFERLRATPRERRRARVLHARQLDELARAPRFVSGQGGDRRVVFRHPLRIRNELEIESRESRRERADARRNLRLRLRVRAEAVFFLHARQTAQHAAQQARARAVFLVLRDARAVDAEGARRVRLREAQLGHRLLHEPGVVGGRQAPALGQQRLRARQPVVRRVHLARAAHALARAHQRLHRAPPRARRSLARRPRLRGGARDGRRKRARRRASYPLDTFPRLGGVTSVRGPAARPTFRDVF